MKILCLPVAEYFGKKIKVYRKCDETVYKVFAIYFQSKLKVRNKHGNHENTRIFFLLLDGLLIRWKRDQLQGCLLM